jgi:uncharacterized surface protein with fasciclin (FAS1) repeats
LAADVVAADGSSIGPTAAGEVLNVTVGANVNLAPGDGSSAANISATDVTATNGVAHTIDAIMGL